MKTSRLSKTQAMIFGLFFVALPTSFDLPFLLPLNANAQSTSGISIGGKTPEEVAFERQRLCQETSSKISELYYKGKKICASGAFGRNPSLCESKVKECLENESELTESSLNDPEFIENCEDNVIFNKSCPFLNVSSSDFATEASDARAAMRDSREQVANLTEDVMEAQKEAQEKSLDAQRAIKEAELEFKEAVQAAQKDLEELQKGADLKVIEAYNKTQEFLSSLEQQYIGMGAELRDKANKIADAEENLVIACRAYSEQRFNDLEKALDEREKMRQAIRVRNSSAASMASQYKKKKAQIAKLRAQVFQGSFSECMAGAGPGQRGLSDINRAKRDAESTRARFNQLVDNLEKQKIRTQQQFEFLQKQAEQEKKQAIIDTQIKIQQAQQAYVMAMQQANQDVSMAQMASLQAASTKGPQLAAATKEYQDDSNMYEMAKKRASCAKQFPKPPSSSQERTFKTAFNEYHELYYDLKGLCESLDGACTGATIPPKVVTLCKENDSNLNTVPKGNQTSQ